MGRQKNKIILCLIAFGLVFVVFRIGTSSAAGIGDCSVTGNRCIFLPAIIKPYVTPANTATPTITPIPTPVPPVVRPIFNGDFELGNIGWTRENSAYIFSNSQYAHRGSYYAQLGSSSAGEHTITQRVDVPANAPYLIYWYTALSAHAGCFFDSAFVWVDANPDDGQFSAEIVDSIFEFCHEHEHLDYYQRAVNLQFYAGQRVKLQFDMSTDSGYGSYWTIDDVFFSSVENPPDGPIPTAVPPPTATPTRTLTPTPTITPEPTDLPTNTPTLTPTPYLSNSAY